MFNQYRMILLGIIIAQGVNLGAMNQEQGQGGKQLLSGSGKKVLAGAAVLAAQEKNKSPLSCSAEVLREKRDFEGSLVCCGSAKAPYYGIPHTIVPYHDELGYSSIFPGAKYNPLNFK